MADAESTARQRKPQDDKSERSGDEDNLFAGTPAEKVRSRLDADVHAPEAKGAQSSRTNSKGKKRSKSRDAEEDEEPDSPWLDVLRVLSFLVLASCGLSYLVSGGESWTWGFDNKPRFLRLAYWKTLVVGLSRYSFHPLPLDSYIFSLMAASFC